MEFFMLFSPLKANLPVGYPWIMPSRFYRVPPNTPRDDITRNPPRFGCDCGCCVGCRLWGRCTCGCGCCGHDEIIRH